MPTGLQRTRRRLQVTGDHAQETLDKIKAIFDTTTDPDGGVKGSKESLATLSGQMREAKSAFGAASIEIGTAFVPVMTDAAHVLKDVGKFMADHKTLVEGATIAVGAFGGAWLLTKGYLMAKEMWTVAADGIQTVATKLGLAKTAAGEMNTTLAAAGPAAQTGADGVVTAAGEEVAAEGRVQAAATDANGALLARGGAGGLSGLGGPAALAVGADAAAHMTPKGSFLRNVAASAIPVDPTLRPDPGQDAPWYQQDLLRNAWNWATQSHAAGGAVSGSGAKGRDSVPTWMAPGEHVLTASDVDAMGGQGNVYAFRNALHREYGGGYDEVGPDVQAAMSMVGTPYSQGSRWDCSGAVGRVISAALGIDAGLPTTKNMGGWLSQLGFQPGVGGPGTISVGWYNHGSSPNDGHAAMTLSDGENAESGGSHGSFLVGGRAAGASSSEFDHHMFLPNLYGEGEGGGGGFGGFGGGGAGFGGGIPAGATAGVGPHGQQGYYQQDAASGKKADAAQSKIDKLNADIKVLEEKKSEETSKTKQSEKDRLDNEIKNKNDELAKARGELDDAEKGSFHASRSGRGSRGGGGLSQFGVPLPANFGLGKGLPGLAEWAVDFIGDMAVAPIEAMRAAGMPGGDGSGGDPGSASGGFADLGDQGTPILTSLAAGVSPDGGGDGGGPSGGGSPASGGPSSNGGASSWYPNGWKSGGGSPAASSWYPGWHPSAAPAAGGPPPVAPYTPGRQLFGPPSPEAGFNQDILEKLHDPLTPAHVDPAQPDFSGPALPSIADLQKRFGNQVPLFPQAPQTSNYTKQWYSPYLNAPGYATGGLVGHYDTGGGVSGWWGSGSSPDLSNLDPELWQALINQGIVDPKTLQYLDTHNGYPDQGAAARQNDQGSYFDDKGRPYSPVGGPVQVSPTPGPPTQEISGSGLQWHIPYGYGRGSQVWMTGHDPGLSNNQIYDSTPPGAAGQYDLPGGGIGAYHPGMTMHAATGGPVGYFAQGGPSGTDTVPAWLTPGEFVVKKDVAQKNMSNLKAMNSGQSPGGPSADPNMRTSTTKPGPGKSSRQDSSSVTAPPAGPRIGEGTGSGFGIGGGLIGMAESAAMMAAGAAMGMAEGGPVGYYADGAMPIPDAPHAETGAPPGPGGGGSTSGGGGAPSGGSGDPLTAVLNRTVGYMGQLGAIATKGVMSSLIPGASQKGGIMDGGIVSKVLGGFAGAHPSAPNTAGKTETPLKDQGKAGKGDTHIGQQTGVHIDNMHVGSADDGHKVANDLAFNSYAHSGGR